MVNTLVSYSSAVRNIILQWQILVQLQIHGRLLFRTIQAIVCSGGHGEDAGMKAMSQNIFVPKGVDMVISAQFPFLPAQLGKWYSPYGPWGRVRLAL